MDLKRPLPNRIAGVVVLVLSLPCTAAFLHSFMSRAVASETPWRHDLWPMGLLGVSFMLLSIWGLLGAFGKVQTLSKFG